MSATQIFITYWKVNSSMCVGWWSSGSVAPKTKLQPTRLCLKVQQKTWTIGMREEGARIHGQCLANCASHISEYSQTYCSYTKELLRKLLLLGCLVLVATRCQNLVGCNKTHALAFSIMRVAITYSTPITTIGYPYLFSSHLVPVWSHPSWIF